MRLLPIALAAILSAVAWSAQASAPSRTNPCEDTLMTKVRADREHAVRTGLLDRLDVYLAEPLVAVEPDCNPLQLKPVFTFAGWTEGD